MPIIDLKQSEHYRKRFDCRPSECWTNAAKVCLLAGMLQGEPLIYVEGVLITRFGLVIDHGWLTTPFGCTIIDPTPTILCDLVSGETRAEHYYPALRWTRKQLARIVDRDGVKFPLIEGLHRWSHPVYRAQSWAANETVTPGFSEMMRRVMRHNESLTKGHRP